MTAVYYIFAALFEIAGCYAFWMWLRLEKSPLWIGPGVVSLILFALLLARIDANFAGRAYAAYGGVYVAASIAWIYFVEGGRTGGTFSALRSCWSAQASFYSAPAARLSRSYK